MFRYIIKIKYKKKIKKIICKIFVYKKKIKILCEIFFIDIKCYILCQNFKKLIFFKNLIKKKSIFFYLGFILLVERFIKLGLLL